MHKLLLSLLMLLASLSASAQFRTDRLINVGRSALYYEDYVLSIQYFNQVILVKPYLYEPWFLRSVAKYYLDDFVGAEKDCTEAIRLNPYVPDTYELRALCFIKQNKFDEAIADYDKTIEFNPYNKGLWFNRALCHMENKDYDKANAELDSMLTMWKTYAKAYSLKAEVCMQMKDTIEGAKYLDKSLEIDPYDGDTWAVRAMVSLSQQKWKDADAQLSKAIHLKPTTVSSYVNRALARYNTNNLNGALADYDKALELDPNNFLAHYNRGQLRVQVGDDNRAIEDFNYIINLEPENVMTIYNRAILLERTGDIYGAIRDYTKLIDKFPNFWVGLNNRARCYRKVGLTAKAELDEFKIFKAQMEKSYGRQRRWSKSKRHEVRKMSEIDFDKYNQLVVADENTVDHEYSTVYRGHVQNRKIDVVPRPMFLLSFSQYDNDVKSYQAFDKEVEQFNFAQHPLRKIYIRCGVKTLTEQESKDIFALIDTLSAAIDASRDLRRDKGLIMQRAVANSVVQNYADAISDLTAYIQTDSTSAMAYWQRAACQARMNEYDASRGENVRLKAAGAIADLDRAITLHPDNAYLYYNRANLHSANKDYQKAVDDYDKAISLDPKLAEAYYNRGIANINLGKKDTGISDLSKAGELGLYDAYSAIKKYSKK